MKGLFFFIFWLQTAVSFAAGLPARSPDAAPLHRAEKALTDVMVRDIFSPPVASRIYLYTNIAAYEVLVQENKDTYRSLYGQVISFPLIPSSKKKISASLASVYAFLLVGKKLVFS